MINGSKSVPVPESDDRLANLLKELKENPLSSRAYENFQKEGFDLLFSDPELVDETVIISDDENNNQSCSSAEQNIQSEEILYLQEEAELLKKQSTMMEERIKNIMQELDIQDQLLQLKEKDIECLKQTFASRANKRKKY